MKFSIAVVVALASRAVHAFKMPKDTSDGVYVAYYNTAGKQVHERVGDIPTNVTPMRERPATEAAETSSLVKRNSTAWCGCGIHMQGGDCDRATTGLETLLSEGRMVPALGGLYAKRGSVVAFVCNHSRGALRADQSDVSKAWGEVTGACGYYIAGTYQFADHLNAGYMRNQHRFCYKDTLSLSDHC